jgi:6-pyruvoyltetrahydropterin/6-carboxytetrahydropterin synthase
VPVAFSEVPMFRVTKEIHFCYGHRLLNNAGKCRFIHGHNGKAVVTVETETLDALGMVVDFSRLKAEIGKWIDDALDHRLLLNEADPIIPELRRQGEPFVTLNANPTAETIARLIFERCERQSLPVVEVTLWETENSYATYRPTPGAPRDALVAREVPPRA